MRSYRKGDRVSLLGIVRHDQRDEGTVYVDVDGHYAAVSVKAADVTLVYPHIEVGERVRWSNRETGEVIGVDDGNLWVKTDNGSRYTWPAVEVTVLEKAREEIAALPLATGAELDA